MGRGLSIYIYIGIHRYYCSLRGSMCDHNPVSGSRTYLQPVPARSPPPPSPPILTIAAHGHGLSSAQTILHAVWDLSTRSSGPGALLFGFPERRLRRAGVGGDGPMESGRCAGE